MLPRPTAARATLLSLACATSLVLTTAAVGATTSAGDPGRADHSVQRSSDPEAPVTGVLAISIDGLNPSALQRLGRKGTPNLHRLMRRGASTLNARTEFEATITLPNHTGMVTGRRIDAATGGHGVTWNDDRLSPATVQQAADHDVDSVFSVVHDAGGSSAVFASKTKFSLWQRSWPEGVDESLIIANNGRLVTTLERDLASTPRTFRFLHLSRTDVIGHAKGFMSRPYLRAVRRVDALVGRAVKAVTSDPALKASTAIILTSDHGGLGANHDVAQSLANYRIAFMVRGPGVDAGADLYALNPDYRNPGRGRPGYARTRQPVRNGAVANLSLDLLGLPPVPGSEHDAAQDLDLTETP